MKKMLAALLALVLVLSFAACGGKKEDPIKVGIAAVEAEEGWLAGVLYETEKYCEKYEVDYQILTSSNAEEMNADLEELMDWGAEVVVAWPQWTGTEDTLERIAATGIPVVNFNGVVDCEDIYSVTGDYYDMGYRCAEHITLTAEEAGIEDAARIVVLDVPSSGPVAEQMKQGFSGYLEEVGYDTSNITYFQLDSFSREDAQAAMAEILETMDQIDGVFSMDDETSMGVIQAIRDAGRTDIKAITGGGGRQEYFAMIADEQYADLGLCTTLYSPSMVTTAINNGVLLLKEKTAKNVERHTILATYVVTSENAEQYLDEDNIFY